MGNTIGEHRNISESENSNLQTGCLKLGPLGQNTSLPHRPQPHPAVLRCVPGTLPPHATMPVIKQEQGIEPVNSPLTVSTNPMDFPVVSPGPGTGLHTDQDITPVDSTTSQAHEDINDKLFNFMRGSSCPCPVDPDHENHELNCPKVQKLMVDSIFEAHTRTCPQPKEHIQMKMSEGLDQSKIFQFKSMGPQELWLTSANKLNGVITQIIEFAKMVPCFLKLPQDDQIVPLKAGSFELAILRMSRY